MMPAYNYNHNTQNMLHDSIDVDRFSKTGKNRAFFCTQSLSKELCNTELNVDLLRSSSELIFLSLRKA